MSAYKNESDSKTKKLMLAVFNIIEEGETDPDPSFCYHFLHVFPYGSISHLFPSSNKDEFVGSKIQMRNESCPCCNLQMPLLKRSLYSGSVQTRAARYILF